MVLPSSLVPHTPGGLQGIIHGCLGEDRISRKATDSAGTAADSAEVSRRYTTPVADYTTRVAHRVRVLKPTRRSEIEGSKRS